MKRIVSGMLLIWLAAWFFIMVFSFNLRASFIEIGNRRYIVAAWTIDDGLPQNSVLSLLQTREGYLWFGTESGLVRFDGAALRIYSRWNTTGLKSDRILSLYQDTGGALWVGTDGGGISRFKEGEWTLYTMEQGLSHNTVRAITGDKEGNLWMGTDNGLNWLNTKEDTIKTYTVENGLSGYSVTALALSSDSTLWIGTRGSGLNRMKKGKFLPISPEQNLYGRVINTLYQDASGLLWIGTDYGLVVWKDGENRPNLPVNQLADYSIKAIMEDSSGSIWIGTEGEGLYQYQPEKGTFTSITAQYGLPDNFIYSLLEDRDGNLWLGTYTTGLVRLKPAKVHTITTANGLPENKVHTLLQENPGYLWAGTQRKGLAKIKIEGNSATITETFTSAQGLPNNRVRALYLDRERNLWVGTEGGGLAKRQEGRFQVYTTNNGLSVNVITAIFQDRSGTLWIGTSHGLNRLKQGKFSLYRQDSDLINIHIRFIGEDREGNLLVGTRNGLFLAKEGIFQKLKLAFDYDVMIVHGNNNRDLWIGTNGSGLLRLKQGDPARCTVFTLDHGLPSNHIFSISEDSSGNLWMSSYRGVFRVSKQELNDFADKKSQENIFLTVVSFDEREGMSSSECVMSGQPSALKIQTQGAAGKLFIPTVKGIAVFPLDTIIPDTQTPPPPVIIENVIVDNESVINQPSLPVLPTETQVVEFYFTALDFTAPDKVRIFYKLKGFDTRWQEASPQQNRMAFYLNLSPGDYSFNVTACSSNGVWNHNGARFEFRINMPFYKRPVFYILILLGLVVLAGGIFWVLNNQKKARARKEEEEKRREKYRTSALLPETVEQVLPRLNRLMEEEKVFLDPDLTLKKLSGQLHVHYNHLSQIINEHLGKSFNDYINGFRIEDAKKRLADPAEAHKTILEIAYDTGFYSKSVFNTAFKKFTGMTPSQYKKAVEKNI